jgi:hypothetical protein
LYVCSYVTIGLILNESFMLVLCLASILGLLYGLYFTLHMSSLSLGAHSILVVGLSVGSLTFQLVDTSIVIVSLHICSRVDTWVYSSLDLFGVGLMFLCCVYSSLIYCYLYITMLECLVLKSPVSESILDCC